MEENTYQAAQFRQENAVEEYRDGYRTEKLSRHPQPGEAESVFHADPNGWAWRFQDGSMLFQAWNMCTGHWSVNTSPD